MYLRDVWNRLDFMILVFQSAFYVVDATMSLDRDTAIKLLNMVRLMRLLRVLQLVKTSSQLKLIVGAVLEAAHAMRFIGVIHFLFYFLFALGGFEAFAKNDPLHFGNFHTAMLTLFRCATLDDWTDVMYINMFGCARKGYERYPALCTDNSFGWGWLGACYFVIFIVIGSFVLLSLFIGVVTATMEEAADKMRLSQEIETRVSRVQRVKKVPSSTIDHYRNVYTKLDVDRRGAVEVSELRIAILVAGQDVKEEELNTLFGLMDANGNGHIDFAEFLLFICDVHQASGDFWKLVYLREIAARSGAVIMPEVWAGKNAGAEGSGSESGGAGSPGGGSLGHRALVSAISAFKGDGIIDKMRRRVSNAATSMMSDPFSLAKGRDAAWRNTCRFQIGEQISEANFEVTPMPAGCRTLKQATRKIKNAIDAGTFGKKPTLASFFIAHQKMVKTYKDAAIAAAIGDNDYSGASDVGKMVVEQRHAADIAAEIAADTAQADKIAAVESDTFDGGKRNESRQKMLFNVRRASGDTEPGMVHPWNRQRHSVLLPYQSSQSSRDITEHRRTSEAKAELSSPSPITKKLRRLVPETPGGGPRAHEATVIHLRDNLVRNAEERSRPRIAELEEQLARALSLNAELAARAVASEAAQRAALRKLLRTEEQLELVASEADRQAVKLHAQARLDHGTGAHSSTSHRSSSRHASHTRRMRPSTALASPISRSSPTLKRSPAARCVPFTPSSRTSGSGGNGDSEAPQSVSKRMLETGRVRLLPSILHGRRTALAAETTYLPPLFIDLCYNFSTYFFPPPTMTLKTLKNSGEAVLDSFLKLQQMVKNTQQTAEMPPRVDARRAAEVVSTVVSVGNGSPPGASVAITAATAAATDAVSINLTQGGGDLPQVRAPAVAVTCEAEAAATCEATGAAEACSDLGPGRERGGEGEK